MSQPKEDKVYCRCGHEEKTHAFGGTGECYIFKHIKGCNYQCVCRKFEEVEL